MSKRAPLQIRDRVVEMRRVRAGDLLPDPKNWRRHPKAQADAFRDILAEIGFAGAMMVRQTPAGLMLIDGHLRAETVPEMEVPVLVLDVTEEEAAKLLAVYDPLSAMAVPDQDALLALLSEVKFEAQSVNDMLEALANGEAQPLREPKEDPGADIDRAEDLRAKWGVERGQVWGIGHHRLMCGDSSNLRDVANLMADAVAEVLWTDPPYGVRYEGKTADRLTIDNDDETISELLPNTFAIIDQFMAPNARIYLAAPPGPLNMSFRSAFVGAGWRFHQGLIWVKDSMVLGHSDYHLRHEDILYGWKPGPGRAGRGNHEGSRWYGGHDQTSVFEIPRPKRSEDHPTMKPPELVERCLRNSSREGDIVADVFLGSGTTMVAAEQTGRLCYGMDIDPKYVSVTLERMLGMGLEPRLAR